VTRTDRWAGERSLGGAEGGSAERGRGREIAAAAAEGGWENVHKSSRSLSSNAATRLVGHSGAQTDVCVRPGMHRHRQLYVGAVGFRTSKILEMGFVHVNPIFEFWEWELSLTVQL